MVQSDIVYAAINPGFIQFFGSDKIAAKTFASAIQSDLYAFSAKDVREWRGMTSISRAAFGVVPIPTLEESIALSRIGKESPRSLTPLKKRIEWTIKAFRAELLECKSFAGSIQLTYAKNVHDNTIIECLKTIVTDLPEEFLKVFAPNETSPEKIIETATETVLKLADKKLFTSRAGLYQMNEMVIEIMDSALDEAIRIASKNSETNTQNYCLKKDIRDNSVDSTTYGKVLRWKKRCDILDSIKKVHEEGIKRKGYEIAEEHNVSPALVSKINMMYKSNKNLTKDDLWEKIRGPKPDPFKIVPAEIYAKLCWIVENEGPAKFNLPFFSWSAAAIYFYLRSLGIEVKLSYIYKLCRKLGITSKVASRKNPKEIEAEVAHFKEKKFPESCKIAIKNGEITLLVDECHVSIPHNLRGYSVSNTPSMCSYDGSLAHSSYTIVTFIGLDGFIKIFLIEGTFDSEKFTKCLDTLKKEYTGVRFNIIMDNSPIHSSYETMGWFLDNKKFFRKLYLPRYCPRMNVVEFYNNIFKQELKKDSVMTESEMIERARAICDKYNDPDEDTKKTIQNLFLKEECSYIKVIYEKVYNELQQNKVA